MTDGGNDREDQGSLFHLLRRRTPSDPAASPQRRMLRDGLRLFRRAARKEPPDAVGHRPRQRLVLIGPAFGIARLAPRAHLGVRQAFRLRFLQRMLLDQKALPPRIACAIG